MSQKNKFNCACDDPSRKPDEFVIMSEPILLGYLALEALGAPLEAAWRKNGGQRESAGFKPYMAHRKIADAFLKLHVPQVNKGDCYYVQDGTVFVYYRLPGDKKKYGRK